MAHLGGRKTNIAGAPADRAESLRDEPRVYKKQLGWRRLAESRRIRPPVYTLG